MPEVFVINKAILILVAGNKDKSMDCEVEESDSKGESAVLEACTDTESKRRNWTRYINNGVRENCKNNMF